MLVSIAILDILQIEDNILKLYIIRSVLSVCSNVTLLFDMDTQLRQLVVGDFPGHREATLSHFKGFTYLIRDSNLSKTLPEDHLLNDLISNIQNTSCIWVLSCSTQTVRSFDGRIFYKKTLAIRTVVVFSIFAFFSQDASANEFVVVTKKVTELVTAKW